MEEYSWRSEFTYQFKLFFKILWKNKSSLVGFTIIVLYVLMATIGPIIVKYDPTPHINLRFAPPSFKHPLGTDYAGRDTLAQIVVGSRDVLLVAFLTAFFTVIVAMSIGITSGYLGGVIDEVLSTIMDVFLTIPGMPLMIIIAASINRPLTPLEVAAIISFVSWAGLARTLRSQVLSIKRSKFIEAARCLGLSSFKIIFSEILPNLVPYIAMNLILAIIRAIYAQVGLYFLGVLPFTTLNWGMMINIAMFNQAALVNPKAWIYLLSPLMAIIILQIGFILFLHALEEIFNPRLREE
mgnify:CR=1 FL=1